MLQKRMYKVLSPIEKRGGGGTYWIRCGSGYTNKDASINIYLDVIPKDGKLTLWELDEEDLRKRESRFGDANLPPPPGPPDDPQAAIPF